MTTTRRHTRVSGRLASTTLLAAFVLFAAVTGAQAKTSCKKGEFTQDFRQSDCTFNDQGRSAWFVLEPDFVLHLAGMEGKVAVDITITVLDQTQVVDGVTTRIVQEYETADGVLAEISRNFFAICEETGTVFYFGEEVDEYEGGVIVGHEGAWMAGVNGAQAGVAMPGLYTLGSRYFQEFAPGVAQDQACHSSMNITEVTPAGTFTDCVEVVESSKLDKNAKSLKRYCPNIGMVEDDGALLVDWSEGP